MPNHDIIVIGASAGGVEALSSLVRDLPQDLAACLFVVLHIPAQGPSLLPKILERSGRLTASAAVNGAPIRPGHIYVAPPDYHLLVRPGHVVIVRGPRENRHRPAVDPLFRSAAVSCRTRVVGVVLTGSRDDGTAGLSAIARCGGVTIVQDPEEAPFPNMPQSAIDLVPVDFVLPVAEIARWLIELSREPAKDPDRFPVPPELLAEVRYQEAHMNGDPPSNDWTAAPPSSYTCPECNGALWEVQDGALIRFRCRIGHAYSLENLMDEQQDKLEQALWVALRTLEESSALTGRMLAHATERRQEMLRHRYEQRYAELQDRLEVLREVLERRNPPDAVNIPVAPVDANGPGKP